MKNNVNKKVELVEIHKESIKQISLNGYTYTLPREITINSDQFNENTLKHVLLTLLCGEGVRPGLDDKEENS